MQLSWSTFALEIINFIVLVWILKRFLYKPVLEVIARRRAGIEKTLADAQALHAGAEGLRERYENRLADWDGERKQARAGLAREIEEERARKMAELQTALEQEREKMHVTEARRQADSRRKAEETAIRHGARFAARLLEQAVGPDTEARLLELVIAELAQLPTGHIAALRNSWGKAPAAILVASAFPLAEDQRRKLKQVLTTTTSLDVPLRFRQDSELLAGLRITIGPWVLGANLRDELKGFTQLAHGE